MAHAKSVTKSLYLTATGQHKKRHQVAVYEQQHRQDVDNGNQHKTTMDGSDIVATGTSAEPGAAGSLLTNSNLTDSIFPIYRLELVAVHYNGLLLEQVGLSLAALEQRVSQLEQKIQEHIRQDQLTAEQDLKDLQDRVEQLKQSLDSVRQATGSTAVATASHPRCRPDGADLEDPMVVDASAETTFRPALGRPYWNRHKGRRRSITEKRLVCEKFLKICELKLTEEIRRCLRMPTFDNWQWEDPEILLLLQQMYVDLNLAGPDSKFGIEMPVLRKFLCQVYMNYNEVPFHNFHHCFCVSQMMYGIIWSLELPEKLGDLETLILLTSCICHDLDHPGFNNIYQINARTELALRYNDISPLENHHCSVAFNILEDPTANIFRLMDRDTFKSVREGMIRCILATDMARHNEIVNQFGQIIPVFDYDNRAHVNLLCMVLIKVADISNEARPMDVAEPWLDCLLQEFFEQSDAEKMLGLPVTPFMDRDKITKPSSQCSFIGFVLLPLFETIERLFPQLETLIVDPVREALEYYRKLNEASKDSRSRRSLEPATSPLPVVTPAPTPTDADGNVTMETGSLSEDTSETTNDPSTVITSPQQQQPPQPQSNPPQEQSQQQQQQLQQQQQQPITTTEGEKNKTPQFSPSPASSERFSRMLSTEEELRRLSLGLDLDTTTETEVDISEKAFAFKIATDTRPSPINHLHSTCSNSSAALRRASLAFIPTTGSMESTLGQPRGNKSKGPLAAVSQPSSPRYVRASILEEADEEEASLAPAPFQNLRVQIEISNPSQLPPQQPADSDPQLTPVPVADPPEADLPEADPLEAPTSPADPSPAEAAESPSTPPPPPPNGQCSAVDGRDAVTTADAIAEARSRPRSRDNPILTRLRHWTDRLKSGGSGERSPRNLPRSPKKEGAVDSSLVNPTADGSKSPRLTSRRLSLSLSRMFSRSLSRSKPNRRAAHDDREERPQPVSACCTPPVSTRLPDHHIRKLSCSLDSVVVQINSTQTG